MLTQLMVMWKVTDARRFLKQTQKQLQDEAECEEDNTI